MVTSMCLDCARIKLEVDTANIHSEKASHTGEPLANPQSEAEEAAGSERAPSVEGGKQPSRSRKVSTWLILCSLGASSCY